MVTQRITAGEGYARRRGGLGGALALAVVMAGAAMAQSSTSPYGGAPTSDGYPYPLTVLENHGFTVGYCDTRKIPAWVAYHLSPSGRRYPPGPVPSLAADERTTSPLSPEEYRAGVDSSWVLAPIAPAEALVTRYGPPAGRQAYLMSNVALQPRALWQGPWLELESLITRGYAGAEPIWVVSGAVVEGQGESLPNSVYLPDAFYAILVVERGGVTMSQAFLMRRTAAADTPLSSLLASVDQIEAITGLDFFTELADPAEDRLEARIPSALWPIQ